MDQSIYNKFNSLWRMASFYLRQQRYDDANYYYGKAFKFAVENSAYIPSYDIQRLCGTIIEVAFVHEYRSFFMAIKVTRTYLKWDKKNEKDISIGVSYASLLIEDLKPIAANLPSHVRDALFALEFEMQKYMFLKN